MRRISILLTMLALVAAMVGCSGDGVVSYDLTIYSTTGGSVTTPGVGVFAYDAGTAVSLLATADADYQFERWSGDVDTIVDVYAADTTITMNDDYSITAEFEYTPVSVPSEWSRVSTPTLEGFVLAPESTIIDYALASDGEVTYAVVEAWDEDGENYEYRLLESDNHAATWTDITDALQDVIDVGAGDYIDELARVATDWESPDFVAVALSWWDHSAGADFLHVFFSTDGGTTFEDAGEVEDGGVYLDIVADLTISPESGGKRDIAIGGTANSMYGAGLFRCTVMGDSPSAWEDATDFSDYEGWDNMWPSDFDMGDIYSELVTDIIFSPSWTTDKTVLVTTIASSNATGYEGVYLQCGSWGTVPGWNEKSTVGIEAVEIKTDNAHNILLPMELAMSDARTIVGLLLPADYNSKNPDSRVLWVWVNYWDSTTGNPPMCDIIRVDDDSAGPVGPMGQVEDGEVWLTNISYHGTIAEGEAITGVLGDGGYPYGGDPTDLYTGCCEGVQVYRNDNISHMDICCVPWFDACKPPTGNNAIAVTYVGDDKAYAVALMGYYSHEEGAWSITFDDGDTWNQLSLIDTYIDYVSDVAVSPDCNKTVLVSTNMAVGCGCDSVWLNAQNLPEAEEYSGKWLRTWCGELTNDWGLLRLAPEETTGDTVFLLDYDSSNVYWNDLEGLACWDPISSPELDNIVDLAVQDTDTLFALDYDGNVGVFDYSEWQAAVDAEVTNGWTVAVWGDHILVGGEDGDVSYSDDGGETFDLLEDIPTIDGYVTVAFDSYFDTNNIVYAATDKSDNTGGIYRWVIGESVDWTDLNARNEIAYTGLVLDSAYGNPMTSAETGGVLYASYYYYYEPTSSGETGMARCLYPAEEVLCGDCGDWDYLVEGLTLDVEGFQAWPDSLKICGCLTPDSNSRLFAIDAWDYYDMVDNESGSVWMFEDCYAKRAPHLVSPADGAAIPANPSTCFNEPFGLVWDPLCDARFYDIQFALDEDFTLLLASVNHYMPSALDAPSYLVAEGELSCEVTYYWRIRTAEDATGQIIHSWWSEPRSFTITP